MASEKRGPILTLAAVLVTISWLLTGCSSSLTFSVIFDKAPNLSPGDPVVYLGIPVGEVVEEKFTSGGGGVVVTVRIDDEYKDLIRTSATFCIEEPQFISFEKQLRIEVWNPAAPPVENGQEFTGAHSKVSCWLQDAGGFVEQRFRLGELNIVTTVDETGATSREIVLDRGEWLPTEWLLGNLLPKEEDGWQRQESHKEKSFEVHVGRQANSPDQLGWDRSRITFSRQESFFYVDYSYEEEFIVGQFEVETLVTEPEAAEEGGGVFDTLCGIFVGSDQCASIKRDWNNFWRKVTALIEESGLVPMDKIPARITLTLPGKINQEQTNASLVAGGTASWDVTAADLNDGFVIRARSRQMRTGRIAGIAIGGLAILVVLVVILVYVGGSRPRRRRSGRGGRKKPTTW